MVTVLLTKAANSPVFDSACSSTVAGKDWVHCYVDSFSDEKNQ